MYFDNSQMGQASYSLSIEPILNFTIQNSKSEVIIMKRKQNLKKFQKKVVILKLFPLNKYRGVNLNNVFQRQKEVVL